MDYGKQTTTHGCENMPNPFRVTVANPDEETKAILAQMFGWMEKVYTDEPQYDPETQYLTQTWEVAEERLVQTWHINDLPTDPTLEDRVDSLEQNVSDIINGATE